MIARRPELITSTQFTLSSGAMKAKLTEMQRIGIGMRCARRVLGKTLDDLDDLKITGITKATLSKIENAEPDARKSLTNVQIDVTSPCRGTESIAYS